MHAILPAIGGLELHVQPPAHDLEQELVPEAVGALASRQALRPQQIILQLRFRV